ncbi:hypothetical protein [Catenulispora pinisilvae]|uniref:hypothetical protein n=1 Tax=Catenulispora pinisilvae TaxID=2705253 RepID=UPI001890F1C5|nr:hypothetical protein [Catenulispora pinisilvae]
MRKAFTPPMSASGGTDAERRQGVAVIGMLSPRRHARDDIRALAASRLQGAMSGVAGSPTSTRPGWRTGFRRHGAVRRRTGNRPNHTGTLNAGTLSLASAF